MDTNSYLAFLLIGTLLVLIDGQIIYRNGRRFLKQATPNAPTESLVRMVTALFHLVTLGVLALLSTIDFSADNQTEGIVIRLGIILLVIGIGHWIALSALSRIRDREEFEEVSAERDARRQAHEAAQRAQGTIVTDPTVHPAYTGESATELNRHQNPPQY